MTISFCQYDKYRAQLLEEQLSWHKTNAKQPLTDRDIEAFTAGFDNGWRQLLSSLKLHDGLKVN